MRAKFPTLLLIFLVTNLCAAFSFIITSQVAFAAHLPIPKSFGLIIAFVLLLAVTLFSLYRFGKRLGKSPILWTIGIALGLMVVGNVATSSLNATFKYMPLYFTWGLSLYTGYHFSKLKKPLVPVIIALFPLVFGLGFYDQWAYRFDYGTWSGEVAGEPGQNFRFLTKEGYWVSHESLRGKIVLLDFWFASCLPCWKKFPELQRIYELYEDRPDFALFAVNRGDDPEILFGLIAEKGYTFPVLRGTKEEISGLGVSWFPTVMLINQRGEVVFKGDLEDAEAKLASLLR